MHFAQFFTVEMDKCVLQSGLYENLLTLALDKLVAELEEQGWNTSTVRAKEDTVPEILARHIYDLVRRSLENVSGTGNDKAAAQIAVVNQLIDNLVAIGGTTDDNRIAETEAIQMLFEIINNSGLGGGDITPRPTLSLRHTGLLVNAQRDIQLVGEIKREIPSADRINLLCAFVRHSGLRLYLSELKAQIQKGTEVRVIASTYTGSTERRALDELVNIGAKVKVSYESQRTRLHAKAWLFHRNSGLHTAYIGSSNLTHVAQTDGLEWNVRVSNVENPEVINRVKATFEQYWQDSEFQNYDPKHDAQRLDNALLSPTYASSPDFPLNFDHLVDVAPKPHQEVALEALQAERNRGYFRNLVVAATGTGKTWVAAFDFKRLRNQGKGDSLLFVAHRKEILVQSQYVFQLVLRESDFGELLVDGERPKSGRNVFASIQSLGKRIEEIDPEEFDVVIVDEFHHAAAKSYEGLISRLRPKILLGLTATPERADGKSVFKWFDSRVAYESRLWDALDQGLLCPFHYFGINDPTDLSTVPWKRGRYVMRDLDNVLTGDNVRALRIRQAVENYVTSPHRMRTLGFCAGVEHAHFMARKFTEFGYPSVALDANSRSDIRKSARTKLQKGKIRAIFTVDLFNEGVDLPEVDTVLMLRPTESATIFLQQLGRGLRLTEGKRLLTVLDFVGQLRREYRYEIRYQAILGGTRNQVLKAVEADFPLLPPGCAITLDKISKETVLQNLKQAIRNARKQMVNDLHQLGPDTNLKEYIQSAGYKLEEIYANTATGYCFTELRQKAGFFQSTIEPNKNLLYKIIGKLIHVDDAERLDAWLGILESKNSNPISELSGRDFRLGLMFFALISKQNQSIAEADSIIDKIRANSDLCQEICDLLKILKDRIRSVPEKADPDGMIPLASHATYSRSEVMAAYNITNKRNAILLRKEGVQWDKKTQTVLLFVTLENSQERFSPQTRYENYPVSPVLFHWESKHTTSASSETGRRYVEQKKRGTNVVLFVRENKEITRGLAPPYHCLGNVRYVSHESERPMRITWELERPMPGWLYQDSKVVAG